MVVLLNPVFKLTGMLRSKFYLYRGAVMSVRDNRMFLVPSLPCASVCLEENSFQYQRFNQSPHPSQSAVTSTSWTERYKTWGFDVLSIPFLIINPLQFSLSTPLSSLSLYSLSFGFAKQTPKPPQLKCSSRPSSLPSPLLPPWPRLCPLVTPTRASAPLVPPSAARRL